MSKGGCEPLIRAAMTKENTVLHIQHEVNNLYTIIEMVKEGVGITLMPSLAFFNLASEGYSVSSLKPPVYRQLALAFKDEMRDHALLALFIQTIKRVALTFE
jgi:DNA-binding transcriptional LysR family regulator